MCSVSLPLYHSFVFNMAFRGGEQEPCFNTQNSKKIEQGGLSVARDEIQGALRVL